VGSLTGGERAAKLMTLVSSAIRTYRQDARRDAVDRKRLRRALRRRRPSIEPTNTQTDAKTS
jgi:hypothetical protein